MKLTALCLRSCVLDLRVKKAPFTADILKRIADDAQADKSLANIRLATMCLIGFAGFFPYSKLANVCLSDIELNSSHSKTRVRESNLGKVKWSLLEQAPHTVRLPC